MGIFRLNKTYRNFQRLQTILNVLLKHGFGELVRKINLHKLLPVKKQASVLKIQTPEKFDSITIPIRFRMVLEELGPTFIKFGQVLSTRPDIIPSNFVQEFKKLRKDTPPVEFGQIKTQVSNELGKEFENIFSEFTERPFAAASIAQVHAARLKTGEEVVVKVMRPGIESIIKNDIDILYFIAGMIEKYIEDSNQFDPVGLVHEFERTILKEIDFNIEASNTEQFQRNFADDASVKIPQVYWEYSSRRVLTMEKIQGIAMDQIESIRGEGLEPQKIARQGMRIFLRQLIEFGLFHADPHPDNVIVQRDGRIALLDFGMVGRLDEQGNEELSLLIVGLIQKDYEKILNALEGLGFEFGDVSLKKLKIDLRDLIETYYGLPVARFGFSDAMSRLIDNAVKHGISVPSDILMLTRAMMISEGIGRQLDPEIDVIAIGRPMVVEMLKKRNQPARLAKDALNSFEEYRRCFRQFPKQFESIIRKVQRNRFRLEFSHVNLGPLNEHIEKLGNRIAFGLVVSSLVLGSSWIMTTDKKPFIFGYPAIGIIGYLLAGVTGLWLVIGIIRSGKY